MTAILRKHAVQCEMTWSKITARRIPKGYRVTASVRAFGLAGTARHVIARPELGGTETPPVEGLACYSIAIALLFLALFVIVRLFT